MDLNDFKFRQTALLGHLLQVRAILTPIRYGDLDDLFAGSRLRRVWRSDIRKYASEIG
jgi:hypothetical protein